MKITLVSGSYPPMKCGIGDYTALLAQRLALIGPSVSIVTSQGASIGAPGPGPKPAAAVASWGWAGRHALLSALAGLAPDVVNIQYPTQPYRRQVMINLAPYIIKKKLKLPVVYTVHEYGSFTWAGRLRIALSLATSAAAIVPDHGNLALMQTHFPFFKNKLHWVPIGPNIEPAQEAEYDRNSWRSRCGAGRETVVFSYFGFLSPSKGIETLLEALAVLDATRPDLDWRFLLIADRQPAGPQYAAYHARIERTLQESPVEGRIRWTGFCSPRDVSCYLSASDVCVLPFDDGASLRRTTLLSALAHGLPVVSTRPKGELDPELEDGKNIRLVNPSDARDLAACMAHLAGEGEERLRLVRGARDAARRFSWDAIGRRAAEVYRDTVDRWR